jgi:hypothetical protein
MQNDAKSSGGPSPAWRAFVLLAALSVEACGAANAAANAHQVGTCPNDLPPTCPTPIPSYSKDVAPLISAKCLPCHGPMNPSYGPLYEYAQVVGQRTQVLDQVYVCLMPPPPAALTEAERQTLLGWLVCASPNN